jgi:hypothetical protein
LAVLAADFRMQRGDFLAYLDEPAAYAFFFFQGFVFFYKNTIVVRLLARLQWLQFCDEIELPPNDQSTSWARLLIDKIKILIKMRQTHLLGIGIHKKKTKLFLVVIINVVF